MRGSATRRAISDGPDFRPLGYRRSRKVPLVAVMRRMSRQSAAKGQPDTSVVAISRMRGIQDLTQLEGADLLVSCPARASSRTLLRGSLLVTRLLPTKTASAPKAPNS